MTDNRDNNLSERGRARRDEMLQDLVDEMREVHRRRRTRRRIAAGSLLLMLFAGAALVTLRTQFGGPPPPTAPTIAHEEATELAPTEESTPPHGARIMMVRDSQPQSIEVITNQSLSVVSVVDAGRPLRTEFLSDAALVATLNEIGLPVGLVRIGDRVLLTDASVDDGLPSEWFHQPHPDRNDNGIWQH